MSIYDHRLYLYSTPMPAAPRKSEQFYMVYGEGKSPPRFKHETSDLAKAEALRLAEANPGTKFYVLGSFAVAAADKPKASLNYL